MRLLDYLKAKKLNKLKFSKILQISPIHMSNICNGKRNPSSKLMKRIEELTNGQVTMQDLYDPNVPPQEPSRKKKTSEKI